MDLHQVRKLEPTCKLVSKVKEPSLEILEEILSRLATKSVLRLSCVSKLWHSVVSDPHFCNLHAMRALVRDNHRSMLLIKNLVIENNSGTRIKTVFTDSEANLNGNAVCHIAKCKTYIYKGTCNGLLIFTCNVAQEHKIILCNPVTREYLYLPIGAPPFHDLDFHHFGLGFDPLREVYKVFRFSLPRYPNEKSICEVYTLGSHGSWRRVCSIEHLIVSSGLYIGGKIFWTTISYFNPHYMEIMLADVASEEIRILMPPVPASFLHINAFNQICPFEFEGLAMMTGKFSNKLAKLWMLKDYEHNQWEHLYTYKLPFSAKFRKTSVCVNNKFLFFFQHGYKLAIYDTRKSSFENNSAPQSCDCVLSDVSKSWRIYGDYKPSLVSLKSFCGTKGILEVMTAPIRQGGYHSEEKKSKTAFPRKLRDILRETMSQGN